MKEERKKKEGPQFLNGISYNWKASETQGTCQLDKAKAYRMQKQFSSPYPAIWLPKQGLNSIYIYKQVRKLDFKWSNHPISKLYTYLNKILSRGWETLIEMLHILCHQGIQIKTPLRYHLQLVCMPKISNTTNHAGEDGEQSWTLHF